METKPLSAPEEVLEAVVVTEVADDTTISPIIAEPVAPEATEEPVAIVAATKIVISEEATAIVTNPPAAELMAEEAAAAIVTNPPAAELMAEEETLDLTSNEEDEAAQNELAEMTKSQLVDHIAGLIQERPVHLLKQAVDTVKTVFYKKHNAELEALRETFDAQKAEDSTEEFTAPEDALETRLKELINLYRTKRDAYLATAEQEKQANYKAKLQIIDELKELTASSETMNNTFAAFRELQKRWRDVGLVPQNVVRDLWETYNHHVETFYSYIKINKELRDLDLKKNYEAKIELCEAAEALVVEVSAVNAFHKLQKLHTQWRETGPVAMEFKDTLWERFKLASSHVNKRHQEHFDSQKEDQVTNLRLKEELCVKAEAISGVAYNTRGEWDKASEEIIEVQKVWKSIGFAPRKDNNRIYERFRAACDKLFTGKREFFEGMKSEFSDNYQAKLDLCVQAEALAESTDWKKTTEDIIELQKTWKTIGATSRKHSDEVWKRFRTACDKFFESKGKHYESSDAQLTENLTKKQAIIAELEALDFATATFENLKAFQARWSAIGYVPIKQKDAIQKAYRELIDRLFQTVRGSESTRRVDNFRDRMSNLKESGGRGVSSERDRMVAKMRAMESEIATLENNIGFFGNSKNADALIQDVRTKIERTRTEIQELLQKIKIIDNQ